MLSLLFFFFRLCLNNLFAIEKLFTFSDNFQKRNYINYNTRLELSELLHDLNIKRLKNSFIESFSLFYSTIKQIILFLLFLLPFQ